MKKRAAQGRVVAKRVFWYAIVIRLCIYLIDHIFLLDSVLYLT